VSIVTGDDPDTIMLKTSEEAIIEAVTQWNTACDSSIASLTFNWTASGLKLDPAISASPTLRLPPNSLVPGEGVRLTVTVTTFVSGISRPGPEKKTLVPIEDSATSSVWLTCPREAITASIRGGSRSVSRDGQITLDASGTIDPEAAPMPFIYVWTCINQDTQDSCGGLEPPPNAPVWTVEALGLIASTAYDFRVTTSKGDRQASDSVTIAVAGGRIPTVAIEKRDIRPKYNANERLIITGAVTKAYASEELALFWNFTKCADPQNRPQFWEPINVTGELPGPSSFLATPTNGLNLVVNPFKMLPGHHYKFILTATGRDGLGSAELQVAMNLPPTSGGCCTICEGLDCDHEKIGMSIKNKFIFTAPDWVDEDAGPLRYRFGYIDPEGMQIYVTDFSIAQTAQAVIAAGCEKEPDCTGEDCDCIGNRVTTTCEVKDQYGGASMGTDFVNVKPYATSGSVAEDAGNMLGQATASGDVQSAFQLVDAFAVTVNDNARRRHLRHNRRQLAEGDAAESRELLVGTLGKITESGGAKGAAGRIATSIGAVTDRARPFPVK
jgi:hypothetical protein